MPNHPLPQGAPEGANAHNSADHPDEHGAQNEAHRDETKQEPPTGQPRSDGVSSRVEQLYGQQYNAREIHMHIGASEWLGSMGAPAVGDDVLQQAFSRAYENMLRGIFMRGNDGIRPPRPEKMPGTPEDLEKWFCEILSPIERCHVRAVAILHGAPTHMITGAAQQLYQTFHPKQSTTQAISQDGDTASVSSNSIAANTFTEVRIEEDARRLYWKDADNNGSSEFGIMALQLIAYEIEGTAGIQGQNCEPTIEKWATSDDVERAWRAAHALGVIWWTLDRRHFEIVARDWAGADSTTKRNSAAGMIFGAYEAERKEADGKHEVGVSFELKTLNLVSSLGVEARQSTNASETQRLSHTVTTTYELIALVSPETALSGLDRLLGLSYQGDGAASFSMTVAVFIYGTLSYHSLALHGEVRLVLKRLADHAERLTRLRNAPQKLGKERAEHLARCEQELEIIFFIFFLLVEASFPGTKAKRYAGYGADDTLGAAPVIPGASGRDVLLASVFIEDEKELRESLVRLLCAALLNGKAKLAMDTLERWADHLFTEEPANEQEKWLWMRYRRFIESIGRCSSEWNTEFGQASTQVGMRAFATLLGHWPQRKPSNQLASEVLGRLGLAGRP